MNVDHLLDRMRTRRQLLVQAAATGAGLAAFYALRPADAQESATPTAVISGIQPDGTWAFADDLGNTIALPETPTRLVAQSTAAAALWDFGVKVVGLFGPSKKADGTNDFQAGDIDFSQVEVLGDYGAASMELDLEKLVALQPDLIVDMAIQTGFWYLGTLTDQVEPIAPIAGISLGQESQLTIIKRFEELAAALGADQSAPDIVAAKTDFEAAEADLKAAIAEKPGLKLLVVSPGPDNVYVASPRFMADLMYWQDLGLDVVDHHTNDFFELISWEQINMYPADLILIDWRDPMSDEEFAANQVWTSLPAVKAGQIGKWYAAVPASYKRMTPILTELAADIRASNPDLV
jgi:iron complex transport system substrate-binding protein